MENVGAGCAVRLGRPHATRQVEIPGAIAMEQQRAEQERDERRAAAAEAVTTATAGAVAAALPMPATSPPAGDPATCLHGASFFLHATRTHPLGRAALAAQIVAAGGAVVARVKRASHLVCTAQAFAAGGTALDEAAGMGLPVVRREFIEACVASAARVPEGPFLLGGAASLAPQIGTAVNVDGGVATTTTTDVGGAGAASTVADSLSPAAAAETTAASTTVTVVIKGRGAVDPDSLLSEGYHVLERAGALYSATLSRTDLATGRNSYYALQVPPALFPPPLPPQPQIE
jgi:hypothetical protein